jgi:hypothetical protein
VAILIDGSMNTAEVIGLLEAGFVKLLSIILLTAEEVVAG